MILKGKGKEKDFKNPYNRNIIPLNIVNLIKKKDLFNKIMNVNKIIMVENRPDFVYFFQKMDELGNFTMVEWLTDLSPNLLRKFINELYEIWNYRAGLSNDDKKKLCPPYGNPFINIPLRSILDRKYKLSSDHLFQYIHSIFCLLLNNEMNGDEEKKICSIHILISLTLVNQNAANALPWLYNSAII
jgi:hypothetical protein